MALFDFLRRSKPTPIVEQTKAVEPIVDKSITTGSGVLYNYQKPSALLTMMGANQDGEQITGDPRNLTNTFKAMVASIPEVSGMLEKHVAIMGVPEIESEEKGFEQEANAMLAETKWRGELEFEGNIEKGLGSFMNANAYDLMTFGQQFYSLLDSQGLPALTSRQKIDGVLLHDSERFNYWEYMPDTFRLDYVHGAILETDKRLTEAFKTISLRRLAKYPWGQSLLYNAVVIALRSAIIEESRSIQHRTFAMSPTVTAFVLKPQQATEASAANIQIIKTIQDQWAVKADEIRDKYNDARQQSFRGGKPVDLTQTMIGEMEIKSHNAASAMQTMDDYPEELDRILSRLVIALHGEPSLLGLGSSGDGMNSNRSQIQLGQMERYGKGLREKMQPVADHIFLTTSTRLSKRLPKYSWKWEGLSMDDLKAKAEIEQMKSTTQKTWVDALSVLLLAGEVSVAREFAIANELDWFAIETGTL